MTRMRLFALGLVFVAVGVVCVVQVPEARADYGDCIDQCIAEAQACQAQCPLPGNPGAAICSYWCRRAAQDCQDCCTVEDLC